MIQNPSTSELKKAEGFFQPKSKNIIKSIIANGNDELKLNAEDLSGPLKNKRLASSYLFEKHYDNNKEDRMKNDIFQALSKILKSSKKAQKLAFTSDVSELLSHTGAGQICESIKGLRSLKTLTVRNKPGWENYWADEVQFRKFAKGLKSLTYLENLNLEFCFCQPSNSVLNSLFSAMKLLRSLKRICIRTGDNWSVMQKFSKTLKTLDHLESITLKFHCYTHRIPQKDLQYLGKAFQALPLLRNLDLCFEYMMNDVETQDLSEMLKGLPGLERFALKIWDCREFTDKGVQLLGKGLEGLVSLQALSLYARHIGEITDVGLKSLGQSLQTLKNLKDLTLNLRSFENITNAGIHRFWQDLSNLSLLESLDIHFSPEMKGDAGMTRLDEVFNRFTSLTSLALDFGRSKVTDTCLGGLHEGLKSLLLLESIKLNFGSCDKITDIGIGLLGLAISMLTRLQNISLDFTDCEKISDAGLLLMSQNFKTLTSLKDINLNFDYCNITDVGIRFLGLSIQFLTCLENIDFKFEACENISKVGLRSICQNLRPLTCLKRVVLKFRNSNMSNITNEEHSDLKEELETLPSSPIVTLSTKNR